MCLRAHVAAARVPRDLGQARGFLNAQSSPTCFCCVPVCVFTPLHTGHAFLCLGMQCGGSVSHGSICQGSSMAGESP